MGARVQFEAGCVAAKRGRQVRGPGDRLSAGQRRRGCRQMTSGAVLGVGRQAQEESVAAGGGWQAGGGGVLGTWQVRTMLRVGEGEGFSGARGVGMCPCCPCCPLPPSPCQHPAVRCLIASATPDPTFFVVGTLDLVHPGCQLLCPCCLPALPPGLDQHPAVPPHRPHLCESHDARAAQRRPPGPGCIVTA